MENSPAYEAALEKVNAATRAFWTVQEAYRGRQIGDAEYLKGRATMKAAEAEFDAAYTAEANR